MAYLGPVNVWIRASMGIKCATCVRRNGCLPQEFFRSAERLSYYL